MEMAQQEAQNTPAHIRAQTDAQKLQLDAQKNEQKFAIDVAKLQLEREKTILNAELTEESFEMQLMKSMMDKQSSDRDAKMTSIDMDRRHAHERDRLHHDVMKHITTLASQDLVKGV